MAAEKVTLSLSLQMIVACVIQVLYTDMTLQKVTGKLLDLSLAPGGQGMGGEGAEAWMGGGGEKIFLLNKYVNFNPSVCQPCVSLVPKLFDSR